MTPILCALLSLGLCLGQRMTQAAEILPKPSFRAENGSLVPLGKAVTFRCRGLWEAEEWHLEKELGSERLKIQVVRVPGTEVEFSFPFVAWNHAGTYYCLYRHSSDWSKPSDPLELVVTGHHDQPWLEAWPSSEVASGQNVTLQCWSKQLYDWSVLYKDGEKLTQNKFLPGLGGYKAAFSILDVTPTHGGTYQCYNFFNDFPNEVSATSNPLVLRVTGTSKDPYFPQSPGNPQDPTSSPPNAAALDYTVGNLVRLILAGLVLILLGILLIEHWQSSRRHKNWSREPLSE